jgi:hypothetical protein
MQETEPRPPSPKYLSKTPSWVSLGFVLGALFVWALPSREPAAPVSKSSDPEVVIRQVTTPPAKPTLTEIEAVFAMYGSQAVWDNDLTEVALWDTDTGKFSRYYEVVRTPENFFFRTIDRLTRPVLTHGLKGDGPMLFTETEEQRQEWLKEKSKENWKEITDALARPALSRTQITTPGDGK